MFEVKIDMDRNLLLIKAEGVLSIASMKILTNQVISLAKKMPDGYTVINDISNLNPTTMEGAKEIVRAQSRVLKSGVTKIIRVVKNPLLRRQFQMMGDTAGFTAMEASSIEEAYEMLSC